jgi:DNA-binding transcriptional ArsR family regulator
MSKKPKPPIALYSALADATRCRILELLRAGPMPVHVLTQAFSISRPAISRHLRVLKNAGLVAEVKKGRENVYAFKVNKLDAGVKWIAQLSAGAALEADEPAEPIAIPAVVEPAPVKTKPAAKPASAQKPAPAAEPIPAASVEAPKEIEPTAKAEAPKEKKPAAKKPIFKDAEAGPAAEPSISQMGFDF